MARWGENDRKSREQYQHHNGRIAGTMKWVGKKLSNLVPGGGD